MIKSAKVSATYNVVETFCESEKENEPQGEWWESVNQNTVSGQ